jgi:hypothetical protein
LSEIRRIDHKDQPGQYRAAVRAGVFVAVGAEGAAPASAEFFVGKWLMHFVGTGVPSPTRVYRLLPDGRVVIETLRQPPSNRDKWQLNADGTFSLSTWCQAMPEYGLPHPSYEVERFHAAVFPDGRFVLWNGDGSLVMLFSPQRDDPQRRNA